MKHTFSNKSLEKAYIIATKMGIKCSINTYPSSGMCPWDGKLLHINENHPYLNDHIMDVWHEIGHALVALKKHWKYRGWGQGMIYDGTYGGPEFHCTIAGVESHASALGIWLQKVIGEDILGSKNHAAFHEWIEGFDDLPTDSYYSYEKELEEMSTKAKKIKNRIQKRLKQNNILSPWD